MGVRGALCKGVNDRFSKNKKQQNTNFLDYGGARELSLEGTLGGHKEPECKGENEQFSKKTKILGYGGALRGFWGVIKLQNPSNISVMVAL